MINLKALHTIVLTLLVVALNAQSGQISGKIKNEKEDGVYKVKISVSDSLGVALGKVYTSDYDGNFLIPTLIPGKYNLQFSEKEYTPQTLNGITVGVDRCTVVNVKLVPVNKKKK